MHAGKAGPHAEIFHCQMAGVAAPAATAIDQRLVAARLSIGDELSDEMAGTMGCAAGVSESARRSGDRDERHGRDRSQVWIEAKG